MKSFRNAQRVLVLRDAHGEPVNIAGSIARLQRADNGAWIRLDERHPSCPFPEDDPHDRGTHLLAYPEDCKAESNVTSLDSRRRK